MEYKKLKSIVANFNQGPRWKENEEELKKMEMEGNTWKVMDELFDPSLETAYQRYIRTPDILVMPFKWFDEEQRLAIA